jgi:kumamolisin
MSTRLAGAVALAILLAVGTSGLVAQGGPGQSGIHVPDSSIEQPGDQGFRAHTNHVISLRSGKPEAGKGPSGLSPQQIRSAYNLPGTGGLGTIAIVDAFDYPSAVADFNTFSQQFGLPVESGSKSVFEVRYATGTRPRGNCGWAQESALDIEWAHAMAPGAKIVLVEAASNSFADLFQAVNYAETLGASQISMSWGGSEFSGEALSDSNFTSDITYIAASGDTGGRTIYPGVSPKVVAAGGTTLKLSNGVWIETGWSGSGGGPSAFEAKPSFQNAVAGLTDKRGVPDFSFDADPNTGVSVYDSTRCQGLVGWLVFGGTSVSSPSLAGIVNLAGHHLGSNELATLYSGYDAGSYYANFRDITSGNAGSYSAGFHWDFVTGIGSNQGLVGK